MKTAILALAGFVAGVGVLFIMKRQRTSPSADAEEGVVAMPSDWRRLTNSEVTPELGLEARAILREHHEDPFGTIVPFVGSDGRTYAGLVEEHYHEPGGPMKPWGYHTGVSLMVAA